MIFTLSYIELQFLEDQNSLHKNACEDILVSFAGSNAAVIT